MLTSPAVVGTTPAYIDVMGYRVREGRFLSDDDEKRCRRVCVIEEQIRRELWPSGSATGGMLFIDNEPYEVVGVLELKYVGESKFELAADSRPEVIVIGDGARPVGVVLPPAVADQLAAGVDDDEDPSGA